VVGLSAPPIRKLHSCHQSEPPKVLPRPKIARKYPRRWGEPFGLTHLINSSRNSSNVAMPMSIILSSTLFATYTKRRPFQPRRLCTKLSRCARLHSLDFRVWGATGSAGSVAVAGISQSKSPDILRRRNYRPSPSRSPRIHRVAMGWEGVLGPAWSTGLIALVGGRAIRAAPAVSSHSDAAHTPCPHRRCPDDKTLRSGHFNQNKALEGA
jgi:hypothetical protein